MPLTMSVQRPLVLLPNVLIAEKQTNKIIANITEYSTAVAASSLLRNLTKKHIMDVPPFTTVIVYDEPRSGDLPTERLCHWWGLSSLSHFSPQCAATITFRSVGHHAAAVGPGAELLDVLPHDDRKGLRGLHGRQDVLGRAFRLFGEGRIQAGDDGLLDLGAAEALGGRHQARHVELGLVAAAAC